MMRFGFGFGLTPSRGSNSPGYVAPTVPVSAKCGYFLIGDDIVDSTTWPVRKDIFAAGAPVLTSGTVGVWTTPEGDRKTFSCNGTSSFGRISGIAAAMGASDDPEMEWVILYKKNATTNASNTIASLSNGSAGQTTPKRVLAFTTGGYRVTQQSSVSAFSHNANNQLQQMVRVRWVNNGAGGNDITVWRNEELDPVNTGPSQGTLTNAVGAQAVNTFTFGAQDNGGTITNFLHGEIFAIWIRDPAAAPLTEAEGIELHNFFMGGYDTAPLYSSAVDYLLLACFGQSNGPANGLATGAVAGLPDANVKIYQRSVNNTAVDPTAYAALDLRGTVHGSQHYLQTGRFAIPHHLCGVGKGATNAGSDWGGQNGAGPTNSLQGYYSTSLPSEVRRNVFMAKARFGGAPRVQILWNQGENDAAAGSTVAGQYGNNLGAIRTYIRKYCAQAFGLTAANIPFHVMKLNPAQTGGGIVTGDLNTINAAIDTLASGDANTYTLSWSDLTGSTYMQVDDLHAKGPAFAIWADRWEDSIKLADGSL